MTVAYIGIGSNLEDPRAQVLRAFDELAQLPDTRMTARSSLYRTAPIGHAAQPDFINAVAAVDTQLSAEHLLRELHAVEVRHRRERSFPNAPRSLDLDLLLYGDAQIDKPGLTVPHPRMHERAFVLQPLLEIAPQVQIPERGAARQCLAASVGQKIERIA
ncbi:MAG: 2-amino-4-hydroxy-6-hydroxymethyldihydropteridine diphosphokinase [Betaproteobacteria bacterium]|nr:2-amino-4-hydroxy-6-hydroxymethyldihydropteridine diphosphokinase [Betaproteobacteria bacterium]MBV9360297.1 2-amino-4-hydroxy-6-hydroxymethyldihydropteridine diphosphokinase [Betaproteobacteria bacterium]